MRFTAHVATKANGSECTAEFEIPDDVLAGLSSDERDELLAKEAERAIYDCDKVEIWFTEATGG